MTMTPKDLRERAREIVSAYRETAVPDTELVDKISALAQEIAKESDDRCNGQLSSLLKAAQNMVQKAEQRVKVLEEALAEAVECLQGLVESATAEANEKGLGGYHGARLSDARAALARIRKITEAGK